MKISRTRRIVTECERTISIRTKDAAREFFCDACQKIIRFIQANEAALVCGLTEREIFRAVETGTVHFAETAQGKMLVCSESLLDLMLPADSE